MKPELISFALCPYVQRSVIALLEKEVEFDITYIDLQNKPDWFLAISPFGKVPVLRMGETVIFESAVINEYLDETNPPQLHPADPLQRALNRAWIEFGGSMLLDQYAVMTAPDEAAFMEHTVVYRGKLEKLEAQLGNGPYFNGDDFSLVDAAVAPVFSRIELTETLRPTGLLDGFSKAGAWSEALSARPSVQQSVPADFREMYIERIRDSDTFLARAAAAISS